MGACFQAKRLASDLDLISSSGSLPVQPGISGIGHQLTVTATAWASVMRRKAAGHLGAVSENQSHKVQCRSAVGRVGLQSTLKRHSQSRSGRRKPAIRTPIGASEGGPEAGHLSGGAASGG